MPPALLGAVQYALAPGGKRLRPMLVLLSAEAVGGVRDDAMDAAAAIELVHNFSLVHDDLPAMDDDSMRRGRPTLHVQSGEAMAILAGDMMLSLAFEVLNRNVDPERASRLTRELAQATGCMIGGQVLDTVGSEWTDSAAALEAIHRRKTGALIRACCRMGGICGSADDRQFEALTQYGESIGLMFQIVDDLLDVTRSSEEIGKTAGKDVEAGKLTYPGLYGIAASRQAVESLRESAERAAGSLGGAARPLTELADRLATRTR